MQLIARCALRFQWIFMEWKWFERFLDFSDRLNSHHHQQAIQDECQDDGLTSMHHHCIAYWVKVRMRARARKHTARYHEHARAKERKRKSINISLCELLCIFHRNFTTGWRYAACAKKSGEFKNGSSRNGMKWIAMHCGATVFLHFVRDREHNWLAFWWSVWIEQQQISLAHCAMSKIHKCTWFGRAYTRRSMDALWTAWNCKWLCFIIQTKMAKELNAKQNRTKQNIIKLINFRTIIIIECVLNAKRLAR